MFVKTLGTALVALATLTMPALPQTAPRRSHSTNLVRPGRMGYLGVGVIELSDERVKALNLQDNRGVEVKRVTSGSAAERAGVKEGDVILELNGKPVQDVEQFTASIAELNPGTKVSLTIWRNGAKQTVAATLAPRPMNLYMPFGGPDGPMPPEPAMPPVPDGASPFSMFMGDSPRVGFEAEILSPQLAAYFGVQNGVLVRTVNSNTPAAKAGLKAGDVVTKVNGTMVTSPQEITEIVRTSRKTTVPFTVVRDKKEMTLNVEVPVRRPVSLSPAEPL